MMLADGSEVWLNAESSVTYPIAFIGDERKVTITGEAYFEIAHDKTKPFFVTRGDVSVQVLGTHFNVNAYDDEAALKVALLEGSVKVASGEWKVVNGKREFSGEQLVIKPGEQASVSETNGLRATDKIDLDGVMAWKNGTFNFKNADKNDYEGTEQMV